MLYVLIHRDLVFSKNTLHRIGRLGVKGLVSMGGVWKFYMGHLHKVEQWVEPGQRMGLIFFFGYSIISKRFGRVGPKNKMKQWYQLKGQGHYCVEWRASRCRRLNILAQTIILLFLDLV